MKLLTKMNSVFYRLFFSYAALLLVTTAAIGATSYVFFTSSLNDEVEKVHSRMLSHMADQLSVDVLGKAQKVFLDVATRPDVLYMFSNPQPGNYAKLKTISDDLKAIVALYPDIVDSVAVYYRDGGTIVSSLHGVAFLNSLPGKVAVSTDWIDRMNRTNAPTLWIETRKVPVNVYYSNDSEEEPELVTLVATYPYNSSGEKAKGYYAVNLKAEAFARIIRPNDEADRGRQWIADTKGHLIAASHSDAPDGSGTLIREIGGSAESKASLNRTIGGIDYFITYTTLPYNGWKLIQATPVHDYNRNAAAIQQTLVLICIAAIVLGLILSRVLTSNMYSPLQALLRSVKGVFGAVEPAAGKHENEYKQIGRLVANLTVKMGELETTVQENIPIIRFNLVSGLLHRTISNTAELDERLRFLQMCWHLPHSCALIVRLNAAETEGLSVEDKQIVVYNLVRELERTEGDDVSCIAIASGSLEISAVFHAGERDEQRVVETVKRMFAYADEQFGMHPAAAWGDWVDDPLLLYASYNEAKAYSGYAYFMEGRRLFPHSEFSARERSHDELPEHFSESFRESLRNREIEAVKSALDAFVAQMETGCYAAEHCHEKWKDWVNLFRHYVKDMNLKSHDVVGEELLASFQRIGSIREFQQWIIDAVCRTFRYLEERERNRGSETIERVKAFVEGNLGQDLSLQVIAEQVHLHPRYLSQLFKEETGVNFVDYVNRKRLETAAQLIKSSDLNMEQIAGSVGFNTPAYFIKKFKELYGVTPKSYKINYTLNQPD